MIEDDVVCSLHNVCLRKFRTIHPKRNRNDHIMKQERKSIVVMAVSAALTLVLSAAVHIGSIAGSPPVPVASSTGNSGEGSSKDSPNPAALSEEYPLYKKALTVFAGGGYEEARGIFEQIVGQQDLPAEIMEDAWRKLADCTYFLGNDRRYPLLP